MSILNHLGGLALKGAAEGAAHLTGVGAIGAGAEVIAGLLQKQFSDNSQRLPKAIERAATRAWRAVEVSLAGRSWWDRCKLTLATGDDRAIRKQVQAYLDANPLDGVDGHGPDFRAQCLAQLQAARKAGLLDRGKIDPDAMARQVGDLSRFGDKAATVDAEYRVLVSISDNLRREGYEALATFLTLRPAEGPPLLVAAMRYFFQREVESDQKLFQGLSYARLESLGSGQRAGFGDLAEAMDAGAERLANLLSDVQAVVVQTHGDVLDIKAELARQGKQMSELGQAVLQALSQQQLDKRELHSGDSFSIRNEDERRLVRDLVRRYRASPVEDRRRMPALLNAVGKLEVMSGDFDAAEKDFREVTTMVGDGPAKAEAAYNAYRASLERRAWVEAMGFLREAVAMDPARFAPFPVDKYEPEKILGAGGFGVAILCRNRHSGGKVVIKTLRRDGLDRDLSEVFREAQALEELEHPAIIRIRDCDYADSARTRPYFVMDFFAGQTLAEHVEQYGPLEPGQVVALAKLIGSGLERAHARGILHRDVKPANILVRPVGMNWEVKLIDFGLALRATEGVSTAKGSMDKTLAGVSLAGTLGYAAPEQLGKLKGVAVGTYSDVYGFGKTCCFALFGTAQPTFQHWKTLPSYLAELLGRCLDETPRARPQNFAEVLRELDRPMPKKRVEEVPVLEALPVEAIPVRPVAKSAPRPQADRDRERRRDSDRDGLRKTGPSGGRSVAVVACLMLLLVGGGTLFMLAWRSPSVSVVHPTVSGPREMVTDGRNFGMQSATSKWPPDVAKIEEIKPEEFPAILAELKKKPDLPRLRTIAGRLMKTTPREDQKKHYLFYERMMELNKKGGGPKSAELDRIEQDDDIRQVSLALQPLLMKEENEYQWYGAKACQKWGTEENVVALIGAADTKTPGGDTVRGAACHALGVIGDPRGIPVVIKRAKDQWDSGHQADELIAAFVAFGPKFETDLLSLLEEPNSRKIAIKALGQIGTNKSILPLKTYGIQGEADSAILAIQRRHQK